MPPTIRSHAVSAAHLCHPIEQPLGAGLQVEASVLMRLGAGDRCDALNEVEDALCGATDYAEQARRVAYRPARSCLICSA